MKKNKSPHQQVAEILGEGFTKNWKIVSVSDPVQDYSQLLTISEFAREKKVQRVQVYRTIERGLIKPVLIGRRQEILIDWGAYKDFKFKKNAPPKSKANGTETK